MKDGLIISALSVLPRTFLSRTIGRAVRIDWPRWMHGLVCRVAQWTVGANLDECVGTYADYPTLNAFFVRPLKPGVRPVDPAPEALTSPVDAHVHDHGVTEDGRLPQSPELDYAVQDLLGGDTRYDRCQYIVLYLAPKDYHRVHSPREGNVVGYRYRAGDLWPVFPGALRRRNVFANNERLVIRLGTDVGEIPVVMVGAFGVGQMTLSFADTVTNTGTAPEEHAFAEPVPVERADELGRFGLGSTVVMLLPPGTVGWTVQPGEDVKLGQRLGTLNPQG